MPEKAKTRILIAAKERSDRDRIRALLRQVEDFEVTAVAGDGLEAVHLAKHLSPDVAVLAHDLPIYDALETAELIRHAAPTVGSILIGNGKPTDSQLHAAMKAGARGLVASADVAAELPRVILDLVRLPAAPPDWGSVPKVIAVTGGRGGIGKSTIASGLAMCLAMDYPERVVLIDLYTQFGDIATMLNIAPKRTLSDLRVVGNELDIESLEPYVTKHETGLGVIIASIEAKPADAIAPDLVEATINTLKRAYQYIIVDLPFLIHPTVIRVLEMCHRMLIVTNRFELQTARDCKKLYDLAVSSNYVPEEMIEIVVNRVSRHDHLSAAALEDVFGRPLTLQVPNYPNLIRTVNQGVPFVKAFAHSRLVEAIRAIADKLVAEPAAS